MEKEKTKENISKIEKVLLDLKRSIHLGTYVDYKEVISVIKDCKKDIELRDKILESYANDEKISNKNFLKLQELEKKVHKLWAEVLCNISCQPGDPFIFIKDLKKIREKLGL